MSARLQRAFLWLAALCALAGTACVTGYLYSPDRQLLFLQAAQFAALASVAALVIEILLLQLPGGRPRPPAGVAPGPREEAPQALEQRRETLEQRLRVDDPHFCTQQQIPCTCWSFCGGEQGLQPPTGDGPAALPVVERSSVGNCPFT